MQVLQEQNKIRAEAKSKPSTETRENGAWRPENPLKQLSARAAFALGAGTRGGWRLGLTQRVNEHVSLDAKLTGELTSHLA